jgi:hypothetical protein
MDLEKERWSVYETILGLQDTWQDSCRPEIYAEGDLLVLQYMPQETLDECMEEAKTIAAAGYRQVLEDGPDVCNSESEAEYSDHGEMWLGSDIYTPDMLDEEGKPILARATMTTEQANLLRQ